MRTAIKEYNFAKSEGNAGVVALATTAQTGTALTLQQNEAIIEQGLETFWQVGAALARVRDEGQWKERYLSWKHYLEKRWGISDRHGRRMIEATCVHDNLKAALPGVTLSAELTKELEDESQRDGIAIYMDGSGKAEDQLADNLKTISDREAVLSLLRQFISKHSGTLAGMYWTVGYLDPEITISPFHYRGRQTKPRDIALLWPHANWTRQKEKYGREDEIQWWAEVDGITLKIENAERLQPLPKPRVGQKVHL
jgi:hypothetical protein